MRTNTFLIAISFLFFSSTSTSIQAQAWANNGEFTPGAKIALHRIWGESMGYSSPEESAVEAKKIYDKAIRENGFVTRNFYNSGVDKLNGTIKFLKKGYYQACYLGNIDATFLNGPAGYTVDIYLKKDCMNVEWEFFIAPRKVEEKKEKVHHPEYGKTDPFPEEKNNLYMETPVRYWRKNYTNYLVNPNSGRRQAIRMTTGGIFTFELGVRPQNGCNSYSSCGQCLQEVYWEEVTAPSVPPSRQLWTWD